MREPPRDSNPDKLWQPFRHRLDRVIDRLKTRGYDPVIFEGLRSHDRQSWLYGIGRTHDLNRKPVTWTMNSRHLVGKAADVISQTRGWNYPAFYMALHEEAHREGLTTIPQESCHLQWGG